MAKHLLRKPVWRRWWVDGSVAAAAVLVGGAVAVGALGQNGAPTDLLATNQRPLTQADRIPTPLTARTAGLASATTSAATVRLRPLRSTTFRAGLVNPASHVDGAVVAAADVDLVAGWAQGDLAAQLGEGWASHRGVAWRTDTWRLVGTRRLTLLTERLSLVRLANRHSQRWLWVAVLPRHGAVRPVQRQLTAQLRPQRTPWLVVTSSRDRFSGGGLRVLDVGHQGPGLRVGRVRVPAA